MRIDAHRPFVVPIFIATTFRRLSLESHLRGFVGPPFSLFWHHDANSVG